MTRARAPSSGPPRGAQTILRYVLPCDAMREAIFGDLHEEFVRAAARLGFRGARWRYRRRAAEVVAHAVWDSLCWRSWAGSAAAESAHPTEYVRALPSTGDVGRALAGIGARARGARADLGFAVLALGVLATGIVVNTMLFSAVEGATQPAAPDGSLLPSALGLGSLVLLLACAVIATALICAGPRWRRRRHQDTVSIK